MKVYTKTGDKGSTALVGGTRVPKNHVRIEAYGTADELISYIGLLRDNLSDTFLLKRLFEIQKDLMILSAVLAADRKEVIEQLPKLSEKAIVELENDIDIMNEKLPALKAFIIPGGHKAVSICHVCRTVCRRAERRIYDLKQHFELQDAISIYFNRLSDYLFVLARHISMKENADEIIWSPVLDK